MQPPVLVVAAVIVQQGRVLLTQRPEGSHLAGRWEFPGGKIEPGEPPAAALARELREETGLAIEVGRIFDVVFWQYPEKDVLLLFYQASITGGTLEDRGVAAHAWVAADELGRYRLPPADLQLLGRLRDLLEAGAGPPG